MLDCLMMRERVCFIETGRAELSINRLLDLRRRKGGESEGGGRRRERK